MSEWNEEAIVPEQCSIMPLIFIIINDYQLVFRIIKNSKRCDKKFKERARDMIKTLSISLGGGVQNDENPPQEKNHLLDLVVIAIGAKLSVYTTRTVRTRTFFL